MTLREAEEKARIESWRHECVQHVNRAYSRQSEHVEYYVSDWYDGDSTAVSYENGKRKGDA
jgi:hypothetical protein